MMLIGLIIPVLAIIFESYPRFVKKEYGVDIWTHLLYLKEYKRQGGIPKKITNGFIVEGTYDYPPAFITILSKFPFKIVERYEFLFSPIFDSFHIILIFFLSYLISQSILISVLTQALYAVTPIVVIENSSATPRSLGYMLFTIVFMLLFNFGSTGNWAFFALSVVFGSLIFLSHRFTTQGFLFFSIFFSFVAVSPWYFLSFLLSFCLAIIVSRGFYLQVVKGHLGNLSFWKNNIKNRFAHQIRGNYTTFKTKDFVFRVYNQFLKFPPFVLTITSPWTIPALLFFLFAVPSTSVIKDLWIWVVFSYILSLATIWIEDLRFLGEGQRYLELSTFPTSFLAALLLVKYIHPPFKLVTSLAYVLAAVAAFITIVVIQRKAIIKDTLRTVTPSLKNMFGYLSSLKKKPRLLCIPHQITTNTIYHTGCPVFVNADYQSIYKIEDVYPFMRRPIKDIMKKYNLDMLLLNEEYATLMDLGLKKANVIREIGSYILVKI